MEFVGEIMIALRAMQCLRIAGKRIATPVCALVRNDILFVTDSTELGAESKQNHCHCEEHSDVAIRFPGIRRMPLPVGQSIFKRTDKSEFYFFFVSGRMVGRMRRAARNAARKMLRLGMKEVVPSELRI